MAALAIAGSVVYRTVSPPAANAAFSIPRPTYDSAWTSAIPAGITVGRRDAPVVIVEFADLECPGCKVFHATLKQVLQEREMDVAWTYVSFPLQRHRFARGAARAAECALDQGQFEQWIDVVYAKQDSLGLKSWGSYAAEAGIADTAAIAACATSPRDPPRIQAGLDAGTRLGVNSTPTVFVNGWRFAGTPGKAQIDTAIQAVLRGEAPYSAAATQP